MVNKCYSNEAAKEISARKVRIKGWSDKGVMNIKSALEKLKFKEELEAIDKDHGVVN